MARVLPRLLQRRPAGCIEEALPAVASGGHAQRMDGRTGPARRVALHFDWRRRRRCFDVKPSGCVPACTTPRSRPGCTSPAPGRRSSCGARPLLFRVVDACVPLLEDGADIDELVEAIGAAGPGRSSPTWSGPSTPEGCVLRLDQLMVPEPERAERQRFPEALAYLETFRDDPYADFRRIRTARVLLAGPPDALGPAARGLVRAGVGEVLVATAEPDRMAGPGGARTPRSGLLVREGRLLDAGRPSRPNAAVVFTEDSFPGDAIERLPARCLASRCAWARTWRSSGPPSCRATHRKGPKGCGPAPPTGAGGTATTCSSGRAAICWPVPSRARSPSTP